MRRKIIPILVTIGLALGAIGTRSLTRSEPDPEVRAALEDALTEAAGRNQDAGLAYVVYEIGIDRLQVSAEGEWAVLWVSGFDRETGEAIGMEPVLGIARYERDDWTVYLPSDPEYGALRQQVPAEILPKGDPIVWEEGPESTCDTSAIGPFAGYKLPWPGGQTLWLTQSIYHTLGWGSNPSFSMIYSFDFSTSPSSYFNVWASRPGTVKYFRDSQPDNDPTSPGNYIVLEDTGTNPTSYQLYLHLAQGSIPPELKVIGAPVQQGQFIGVADDTGASSNHHLHFQVHTEVSWWGCSVDVRFDDVPINGGRPRLPVEAQNYPQYGSVGQTTYVSGNTAPPSGIGAPGGGILEPGVGQAFNQPIVNLDGYAFDYDSGLVSAQFVVDYGTGWQTVGPVFPISPASTQIQYFNTSWDMCGEYIPDGLLKVGVSAVDTEGKTTTGGMAVPIVKNAPCIPAPPACQPGADEAAIFELPDYRGDCQVLPVGSHTGTYPAASVLLGSDVSLSLYVSSTFKGRSQTFWSSNANLADDRSGADTFSAAIVQPDTTPPGGPLPSWPSSGEVVPLESSITLYWHDRGGSEEFQARLVNGAQVLTSTWTAEPLWDPGLLLEGSYDWSIRARSAAGTTAWSVPRTFIVGQTGSGQTPPSISAPFTEDFESGANGWSGTGLWNLLADGSVAYSGSDSWWYGGPPGSFAGGSYDTGSPTTGSLTSPPIDIPGSGYYLRFYSRYETESPAERWDRRRVLVSEESGPFLPLYQMDQVVMNKWVRSPYLDLSPYAGKTIQLRFVFDSLDARYNDYSGWVIDKVTVDTNAPPVCSGSTEPDNTPANATQLSYGGSRSTEICPAGDVDYYKFSGQAGERIVVDIAAAANGSPLDAYLELYDADGESLLTENDDEVPGALLDPLLGFTLPRSGTYYLRVRAYSHPGGASSGAAYTLTLDRDLTPPSIGGINPSVPLTDLQTLPATVTLTASASDSGSGMHSIRYLFHSADWGGDDWIVIGTDMDGSDGWSVVWDTTIFPPEPGMALVVQAFDRAGNVVVQGLWNLFPLQPALYLPITIHE